MKIKNLLSLLLLLTSFQACTSSDQDKQILIFNSLSLKLIQGESLVDINPEIKEKYLSYFKNSTLQIPLFKCIKNKDYTLYLGIPYDTSIEKLVELQTIDQTSNPTVLQSDTVSYLFKKQKNDTTYLSEYSKVFDQNLIYVLAVTHSKTMSDSLFNQTDLANRFNQK